MMSAEKTDRRNGHADIPKNFTKEGFRYKNHNIIYLCSATKMKISPVAFSFTEVQHGQNRLTYPQQNRVYSDS